MSSSDINENRRSVLTRRQMLKLMGATGATAALVACGGATPTPAPTTAPTSAPAATEAPVATDTPAATATAAATEAPAATATTAPAELKTSGGKALPADAAPSDQQVYLVSGQGNPGTDGQITGSVYNRSGIADVYAIPLTCINHDFELIQGAATEWKVSDDGLSWTFKLRQDLPWSDGSGNCNADDFVATMQHMADPAVAYDFTWYWDTGNGNIKNLSDILAKKMAVDQVGVSKIDDYTLKMETSVPTPYLPRLGIYFMPFNAKALKEHGAQYMTNPDTCVVCGPFMLKEWSPTRVEVVANNKAPDDIKPLLERVISVPYQNAFQAYQAGNIDAVAVSSPADIETVLNDATLSKEACPDVGDFRTDYFFFDVTKEPFSNAKFREALGHLLDRENIVKNIVKPILGRPAYGFLAPGFPASNEEALKDIQAYDPDKAKQLYADSGVKVDKLTIIPRNDGGIDQVYSAIASTYADAIKTNLGITVEIKPMVQKEFTAALLAKPSQVDFGIVSYGMDYLDPSNMLGVFKGTDQGGRHTWNDKTYQDLLTQAGPLTDEAKRTELYQQAEKILTESFAFVWIYHRTPVNLWKSYLKGPGFLAGKTNTNPGWAWGSGSTMSSPYYSQMYVSADVAKVTRAIP